MLDDTYLISKRPRPPARNSINNSLELKEQEKENKNLNLNLKLNKLNNELNESPLSQVAKLIQNHKPGSVEFKSSTSFIEAWSYNQNQQNQPTNQPTNQQNEQEQEKEKEKEKEQEIYHQENSDLNFQSELQSNQFISSSSSDLNQNSITHEWVSAKTRQELENLLLAADRVIRERERDLGIAASIGKSLLENNIALRARQEKLLAHISATSLPTSPNHRSFEDLLNHSEYIEARPPPSPSEYEPPNTQLELSLNLTPSPHNFQQTSKHSKSNRSNLFPYCLRPENSPRSSLSSISSDRIKNLRNPSNPCQPTNNNSNSPNTLNRLSQQNEYLAQQLADLQSETAQSEVEGRKRLRKLVKELETLRTDLRHAEERNALLEEDRIPQFEQQDNNVGNMVDEIVGDMKRVMLDDNDLMIKMYTPIKSTASISRDIHLPNQNQHQHQASPINSIKKRASSYTQSPPSFLSTTSKRSSISTHSKTSLIEFQPSPQERALVSQLLGKISELKESQVEFEKEREEMKLKLNKAKDELEHLQGLFHDAEFELQQVKQIDWDPQHGLIEWNLHPNHHHPNLLSNNHPLSSSRKASGNRKMINQSRKSKKRQWPAPEHHPGSIGSDMVLSESNVSSNYGGGDPASPSFRGQALSMARQHSTQTENSPDNRTIHSDLDIRINESTQLNFWTNNYNNDENDNDNDGSVKEKKKKKRENLKPTPPLRTLLSEMNGFYQQQEHQDELIPENDEILKTNFMNTNPNYERNNSESPLLSRYSSTDKKSDSTATSGSSKKTAQPQPSYTELQREVAETPLRWADESVDKSDKLSEKPGQLSNERKRDSTHWLYTIPRTTSTSHSVESWSPGKFATLESTSNSIHHQKADSLIRPSQLFIQHNPNHSLDHHQLNPNQEDAQSSTFSSSTTIGRNSPSDNFVHTNQSAGKRVISRREEALKRLGISSFKEHDEHRRRELGKEQDKNKIESNKGKEEDQDEDNESWNQIDSIDLDDREDPTKGENYYLNSIAMMRGSSRMITNRFQSNNSTNNGTSWGTFVYQWMKLVSVVGLAVGWAVWQGPKSALEDDLTPFLPDQHDHVARHRKQKLAIQNNSSPDHLHHSNSS